MGVEIRQNSHHRRGVKLEEVAKPKPQKKIPKEKSSVIPEAKTTWVAVGFDVAMSNISGAAFAYDQTLRKMKGPVTISKRWTKDDHYFERLKFAANGWSLVKDLEHLLGIVAELDEIYIAVEEPWAFGQQKRMQSNALKQQAQISGAFLGGLLRYGFQNIHEINNLWWRQIVANDLGISIHWSKWNPDKRIGKFRAKEWCQKVHPEWKLPDFPDILQNGLPKPDSSMATARQADDRYEAVAMAVFMMNEIVKGGADAKS